jgi:two-component system cell cycle sensor histidine kinase/response regulator CckA
METIRGMKREGSAGGLGAVFERLSGRRPGLALDDVLSAVPEPRQVVGPGGAPVFTSPAFTALFGEDPRPAPALFADAAVDDDSRAAIVRLGEAAAAGRSESAVVALHPVSGGMEGTAAPRRYRVSVRAVAGRPDHALWMLADHSGDAGGAGQPSWLRPEELLDQAPLGIYAVDAEGRLRYANRAFADLLGLPVETLGRGDLRLPDLLVDGGADFDGPDARQREVRLKADDGQPLLAWIAQEPVIDARGRTVGARGVVRRLAEAPPEPAGGDGSDYRLFFDASPVGIALVDPEGRVLECNEAVLSLAGGARGEEGPPALAGLVAEPDRPAVLAALEERGRESGIAGPPLEVHMAGEGETVCALYLTRLEDTPGETSGFVAHFIDTTEHKSLERQFAQSQKMQAVGQLAGGIAHDFNNLLTAMIGFSDLLLLRHRPGDQSFADIMHIKQNANRAASLVRQLLAFSRQQTLQPRVLDVTDILAELSHLLRRLIGETIELKMVHGRDLGAVKADQGQLEQVIINLAVNARDAMTEGGTLTIETDNVHLDRPLRRKSETIPAGDYTRIRASDTGCGIPDEIHDRIFDPFYSTKEVGAGTGLGLSTVYGIVSQTGGFVEMDSRVGQGTSFSIYLPHHVASEGEATAEETAVEASRDLTGVGTVLLVEDEDAVRAFGARALRNKGYNVLEAPSGEAALELLAGEAQAIDLLITDVVMPKLDGPALVREVRETRPDLPVIFISGYAEDSFRKRVGEDTAIHFLPKPFSLKELAGKVKEVMGEAAA